MLKQFIPDHKRHNRNRYGNNDAAFDNASDYDFLSTLRFKAPYHYDCNYEASVNQA